MPRVGCFEVSTQTPRILRSQGTARQAYWLEGRMVCDLLRKAADAVRADPAVIKICRHSTGYNAT